MFTAFNRASTPPIYYSLTHAGTTPVSTTNSFCERKALWFIQKLFAILSPFVMVVAGSFLLSSCSAEALISSLRGNEIQFEVTENPIVPDSGATSTRATMVTSLSQIKVYAYDASGNTVINGAIYTNNNGTWTSSTSTEWPSGTVTFYAFSPANNSSVSFNTSTKQLTYTAPTAQGSQQDVCYAYTSTSRPASNTVALTFNHANAAFSVNARLASGCTATVSVSGVSIVNVKPTNTLTFNNSTVSASGSNITSALKCSTRSLTTTDQAISTEPLMLPPQTVTAWAGNNAISSQTGAYLAVNCKVAQDDKYVVGSATADGTVYVPMSKPLNRGENNSVNLVFGNEENGARCYGRDANGNRITVSSGNSALRNLDNALIGQVVCTDYSVYNTVAEATAAGKTPAGMIATIDRSYYDEEGNYYPNLLSYLQAHKDNLDFSKVKKVFRSAYIIALKDASDSRVAVDVKENNVTTSEINKLCDNYEPKFPNSKWYCPSTYIINNSIFSSHSHTNVRISNGSCFRYDDINLSHQLALCGADSLKTGYETWDGSSGEHYEYCATPCIWDKDKSEITLSHFYFETSEICYVISSDDVNTSPKSTPKAYVRPITWVEDNDAMTKYKEYLAENGN